MEQQVLNNNNSCDNITEEFPIDIKDEEFVSITADDAYTAIENETVQLYTQIANKKKCRQFVLVVPTLLLLLRWWGPGILGFLRLLQFFQLLRLL